MKIEIDIDKNMILAALQEDYDKLIRSRDSMKSTLTNSLFSELWKNVTRQDLECIEEDIKAFSRILNYYK